ncbi:MAG: pyridoxal-phosphate dependent enzyme [Oscillibacter sp.]|nr:pyridoxal-phosphate dependent enzyme [Oscillibacter sp.]
MSHWNNLPQLRLGVYPTPFYRLENISRIYNKSIWIKRDDLCGVALGGNKVRKLEYLLADAQKQGCDTVFTTGGAQSNHAMLTAACAAEKAGCHGPQGQSGAGRYFRRAGGIYGHRQL